MEEARVLAGAIEADEFLNSFLRVYAVASMGFCIYLGLNRLASINDGSTTSQFSIPDDVGGSSGSCDESCEESDENGCDASTEGGNKADKQLGPEFKFLIPPKLATPEKPPVKYPIEQAIHDVNADLSCAFTVYHYNAGPDSAKYIIMRYDSASSSFAYWCDVAPSWDILQITARKFVTENRCAALYACAEVTTEAEASDSETEDADGGTDGTATKANTQPKKSLTTKVDNVYVKIGRLDAFRTTEKEAPKNATVDYKKFATMRARANGGGHE